MNKDNAKDFLPLVQALADGKVIQVNYATGWEDVTAELSLCFAPDQYRIKPEPREIWVNEWEPSGKLVFYSQDEAADHAKRYEIVHSTTHYREVIE